MTVNYEIGSPRKDRRMRITLLVCIGKTKKRVKTEYFATPSDINRKGKLKSDSPLYDKVRRMSFEIEHKFSEQETYLTGERITATDFLTRLDKADIPTFFTYASRWLSKTDIKGKKNYKTALNKFRSFTKKDISFGLFSHILLEDFKYFLRDTPRAQSQYLSAIKKIYTDAEKDYNITPFSSFRFQTPRQQRTPHRAVTRETLLKVFSYNGTSRRAVLARDCCKLSFLFCGMNSVDLFYAPPIKNNILRYDRVKTKDRRYDNAHMELNILPQARELVKKYKDTTRAFSFHRQYSTPSNFNTALNKGLKTIGEEIGVTLTFYAIRHTWASIARNDLGIDKSTIHEALCHIERDTAIDDIYIRKDYRLINEANKRVTEFTLSTP